MTKLLDLSNGKSSIFSQKISFQVHDLWNSTAETRNAEIFDIFFVNFTAYLSNLLLILDTF
jgi:hypothetical protein